MVYTRGTTPGGASPSLAGPALFRVHESGESSGEASVTARGRTVEDLSKELQFATTTTTTKKESFLFPQESEELNLEKSDL